MIRSHLLYYTVCTLRLSFPIQLIHLENMELCDRHQVDRNLWDQRKPAGSLDTHIHHGCCRSVYGSMIVSTPLEKSGCVDYMVEGLMDVHSRVFLHDS